MLNISSSMRFVGHRASGPDLFGRVISYETKVKLLLILSSILTYLIISTISSRSFGVTFGTVCLNLCTFAVVFLYQFLEKWIYIQGCIIVFGTSSLLGLIYIIMFVEETRGKDLNVVDNENEDTASHGVPAHEKEKP